MTERGSGRTSAQLREALAEAQLGMNVAFVCTGHRAYYIALAQHVARGWAYRPTLDKTTQALTFESGGVRAGSVYFFRGDEPSLGERLRERMRGLRHVVVFDHAHERHVPEPPRQRPLDGRSKAARRLRGLD